MGPCTSTDQRIVFPISRCASGRLAPSDHQSPCFKPSGLSSLHVPCIGLHKHTHLRLPLYKFGLWLAMRCHGMECKAWHGMARHGMAWRNAACHGMPWHAMAWHTMACHGMEWRCGMPRHAWHGMAYHGMPESLGGETCVQWYAMGQSRKPLMKYHRPRTNTSQCSFNWGIAWGGDREAQKNR